MCERKLEEIIHIMEKCSNAKDLDQQMLSLKERFPERDVFAAFAWLFLKGLFGKRHKASRRVLSFEERSALHVDALGYLYALYEFGTLNDTVFDEILIYVRASAQMKKEKIALSEIKKMVQKHLFSDYLELQPTKPRDYWLLDEMDIQEELDIKIN